MRKPPKRTKAWYRRKCVEWAKAEARKKGMCEYCGKTSLEAQMQGSHIFPQEYQAICADTYNILCLCSSCHKFSRNAWHKGPEIAVWLYRTQTMRYNYLALHKDDLPPDWKERYEEIKKNAT